MPLDPISSVLTSASFAAMGSVNTVVVDDASALPEAMAMVQTEIREIDRVCSRFRADSELSRLNRRSGEAAVPVSPLLEEAIATSLQTARMTGGLVDPTVGRCIEDIGYVVTFRDVPPEGPALDQPGRPARGWRFIAYDPLAHTVGLPAGVCLDLGASGKAWAADRAAAAVALRLDIGVVVDCGGDVSVGGRLAEEGWPVRVTERVGAEVWQDVMVFDGGLATSGITARSWRRGGVEIHHIVDPATGLPARTPWSMVSVAAATCVEANAAATAAIVMGDHALGWLDGLALPSRLVTRDGRVHFAGGWQDTC